MAAAAADRLDKETSKGIFHLELPWTGELCLTIPAQFCGMPVSALTVGPLIVASVATPSFPLACCAGLVFVVLASCWATLLIKKGVRDGTDQMLSSPTGVLVAPLVTVAALSQPQLWGGDAIEGAAAFSAGSFSCTCYFASQLLVASIKWTTLRRRPIHLGCARQLELDAVDRFFALAAESKYIGVGLATFESFPSGDSCQASQWATLLWLLSSDAELDNGWARHHPLASIEKLQRRLVIAGCIVAAAACFGRVYFHAHHIGDVLVGAALGHAMPRLMNSVVPWRSCGWWHVLLFHIGFVAVQAVVRRHFRASLEVRAGLDPGSTRDPWRSMNRDE